MLVLVNDASMKIDVVDSTDRSLFNDVVGMLNAHGSTSTIIDLGGMCNGVGQMVNNIISACGQKGVIDALRIWGHGNSGLQNVSAGTSGGFVFELSSIALSNIDLIRPSLNMLQGYFNTTGRVELKGCEVASGDDGENLLLALSFILQVPVYGGVPDQYGVWVDPVVCAQGGGLSSVIGPPL